MKIGHLIESKMSDIFLQKRYTVCGRETSPRSLSEKLSLSISLGQ